MLDYKKLRTAVRAGRRLPEIRRSFRRNRRSYEKLVQICVRKLSQLRRDLSKRRSRALRR